MPRYEPTKDLSDAVAEFAEQLAADQGGSDRSAVRIGLCNRLAETEALCRLLGRDLATRGIFTPRGRTRATFDAFLRAVSAWQGLAGRLGVDRRPKEIEPTDPLQWLEQRQADGGATDGLQPPEQPGCYADQNPRDEDSRPEPIPLIETEPRQWVPLGTPETAEPVEERHRSQTVTPSVDVQPTTTKEE
jgi:hypothetical protein